MFPGDLWLKATALLAFLLWLGKSFEILVFNRLADHLKQVDLFYDSRYGFTYSLSITDIITVVSDRNARALTGLGVIEL